MLRVREDRLRRRLLDLASIGARDGGGVTRLALSDADRAARDRLVEWMQALSLEVRVDDLGNIYGRRPGRAANAPAVMIGSHIDTVPHGGRFDGAVGVMAGLEVVEVLNEAAAVTDLPVEVAAFTNEEGARFEPTMMGSGAVAGILDTAWVEARRARDTGATFLEELERIGYRGAASNRPAPSSLRAYLEYHVEQGPVLEDEGLRYGVVEGVVGFSWLNVVVEGETDHSGPTPMSMRRDALVAAGRMVVAARDLALEFGDGIVVTVGRLALEPNVTNAIPGRVEFSIDIRHPRRPAIDQAVASLRERVQAIASEERGTAQIEEIKAVEPVAFDAEVVEAIAESAAALALPHRRMTSGAGHDAQYMSSIAPAGMIFAPSRGGKSHSPQEWTEWEDVAAGADVLLGAVLRLAGHVQNKAAATHRSW